MKLSDIKLLLKNKKVLEEINKHLWIESQKSGFSIGIERATDEWLRLYGPGWLKHNAPGKYGQLKPRNKNKTKRPFAKKTAVKWNAK